LENKINDTVIRSKKLRARGCRARPRRTMEGVALVPVQEIHALLQRVAGELGLAPPALPAEFRFRLKELRVKRVDAGGSAGAGSGAAAPEVPAPERPAPEPPAPEPPAPGPPAEPAPGPPAEAPLSAQSKIDVCETWLTYCPLLFAQPWGFRRALMGDLQDQPVAWLSAANYPSLEFWEEPPQRTGPRRLEFQHEARNGGAPRRVYRPMMAPGDLLRFLASARARGRGAAGAEAEAGGSLGPVEAEAPAKPEPAKPEPAKPEPAKPEPAKLEPPPAAPGAPAGPALPREHAAPAAPAAPAAEPAEPALRRARRFSELEADCAALGVGEGSRVAHGAPAPDLEPARRRARALLHGALVEAAAGLLEALAR
jgi:hypothetical protein